MSFTIGFKSPTGKERVEEEKRFDQSRTPKQWMKGDYILRKPVKVFMRDESNCMKNSYEMME